VTGDGVEFGEFLVGLARRLGVEPGGDDVEDVIEVIEDAELARGALGVSPVAIGEDEFAAWKLPDRGREGMGLTEVTRPRCVDSISSAPRCTSSITTRSIPLAKPIGRRVRLSMHRHHRE